MHPTLDHSWDLSRDDARRVQRALSSEVIHTDDLSEIRTVCGVHVSYPRSASGAVMGRAAVVVMRFPELVVETQLVATRPVTFPYMPALRSFREAPVAFAALSQLDALPDLLMVNGHGIAEQQRFGIANHVGVLLGQPTIGCSSTPPGAPMPELGTAPGSTGMIVDETGVIGAAVRTRSGSRPLVVSVGHRVSLDTAVDLILRCTRGRRLPEPLKLAEDLSAHEGARGTAAPESISTSSR